jgi:hypothetical protein
MRDKQPHGQDHELEADPARPLPFKELIADVLKVKLPEKKPPTAKHRPR